MCYTDEDVRTSGPVNPVFTGSRSANTEKNHIALVGDHYSGGEGAVLDGDQGYTLHLRLKSGDVIYFGPGPAQLLEYVEETNSLHEAAARMGMAYSKAWRVLKTAERQLGWPLLHRSIGGLGGGGSRLTDGARSLLRRYRRFEREMYSRADELFAEYFAE